MASSRSSAYSGRLRPSSHKENNVFAEKAQTFLARIQDSFLTSKRFIQAVKRDQMTNLTADVAEDFVQSLQKSTVQVVSRSFSKKVKQAFREVDLDEDNVIDQAELYSGILLLYHKINMIPWGGRKPPPKRKFVLELFERYLEIQQDLAQGTWMEGDEKLNRGLTLETFEILCREHFELVVTSVMGRIIFIAVIFPFLSYWISEWVLSVFASRDIGLFYREAAHSIVLSMFIFLMPYIESIIFGLFWEEDGFSAAPFGTPLPKVPQALQLGQLSSEG